MSLRHNVGLRGDFRSKSSDRLSLMVHEERFRALRSFECLRDLDSGALDSLVKNCIWQEAVAGKQIVSVNETSNEVYFIISGKARVVLYSAVEGKPVLFVTLGPGEVFGEVAAIDGGPRSATVEVEDDSVFAILPNEHFKRLSSEEPTFAFAMMRRLASHVRRLSDRVYEYGTLGVQARVYAELLRLTQIAQEQTGQCVLSPAPLLVDIAATIATHREAVSRVISRLQEANIVRRDGADLRILDLDQLVKLVRDAKGD